MFDYFSGTLQCSNPNKVTLEVGGVGYLIFISVATFQKLPRLGESIQLFTSHVVREDSQKLFGFRTREERDFFDVVRDISGIGPKLALSLLGHLPLADLHFAVEQGNHKALTQVPGIGKKMAERLMLELRNKFEKMPVGGMGQSLPKSGVGADAISALINLGYGPADAQKSVKKILEDQGEETSLSEVISLALKGT